MRPETIVLLTIERIVELSCRLRVTMLHISHFSINSYLNPCVFHVLFKLLSRSANERGVSIDYMGCHIQNTTNGYWIEERRWIEGNESGSSVCECCCGGERELESLFQKETTEYHKVMSVTILRLHEKGGL